MFTVKRPLSFSSFSVLVIIDIPKRETCNNFKSNSSLVGQVCLTFWKKSIKKKFEGWSFESRQLGRHNNAQVNEKLKESWGFV